MKYSLLLMAAFFAIPFFASAQMLKGKITDQSGKPIEFSTVYIRELRQGTTSNSNGDYEISLPKGNYMVTYQSLGYQPVIANITLSGSTIKDVVLLQQIYEITEVKITASGEDRAYGIMRKAIGLAPYYLNNVSYYKAEVYLKGNLAINKIPKLLQKSMKIESGNKTTVSVGSKPKKEEKLLKAGDSFIMESMNEIEFTAPDKYFQKMISYNSTFPAEGNEISPMSFIQASFYQPVLAEMAISPLAPNAFSHYNYKFQGASPQGNFTINKIQVIPKRKSQQLFEGTIYIVEDLWCLQSVDLTNENLVGKIRVEQLYTPVQDEIWMPVSHKFEINIGIIGFKADAGYTSSVKYSEVKPNLTLQKPASLTAVFPVKAEIKPSDTIVSKSKQQINKILEKDKLSNRDMFKLSKLMEKESKASVDSGKKSLEIKDRTTHIIEKDANKRDSTYWAKIRPIPLSSIELKSIRTSDSLKAMSSPNKISQDTIQSVKTKQKGSFKRTINDIVLGHTWSDTTEFRFTYSGLLNLSDLRFNSVDGFIYGLDFSLSKSWKKTGNSFSFVPDIRWAFSRERLEWGINTTYSFDNMKHKEIFIRTGSTSKDINNGGGINPFINSIYSLLLKENYLKLYESKFITLGYRTEITNGLTIRFSANYEDRNILHNTTNFSILKSSKIYSPNIPGNPYLQPGSNEINQLRNQKHIDFLTDISYTPYQKYRIHKGVKLPAGSDWPTFNLSWEHGLNDFSEIAAGIRHFDMIRFEVSRSTTIGAFSNLKWRVRTAGFVDNRNLTFYDFFHINSQPLPIMLNNYEDAFMIPSFYSLSTPEFYAEAHLKYTSPYLLLKLLPGLSNTLMRENVSFSYLGSRYHTNYTEFGYSISEILFIGELGVYIGFDDLKYRSVGLRAILKFN
jgi:hypothetical protein